MLAPAAVTARDRAVTSAVAVAVVELSVYLEASAPPKARPAIVTVLPVPTYLLLKTAEVHVSVTVSPGATPGSA